MDGQKVEREVLKESLISCGQNEDMGENQVQGPIVRISEY